MIAGIFTKKYLITQLKKIDGIRDLTDEIDHDYFNILFDTAKKRFD